MPTIICAEGERDGKHLIIRVVDSVTYINGLPDDSYDYLIHEQHPIGGTYFAEPNSMTNIQNTLALHFFDHTPKLESSGEFEKIPYEKGTVY